MYFSCQSDKYSLIFLPLKIKFFWRQFQDFQEFHENSQNSENSKMCWNRWILDSYCNTHPKYVFFSSVWQIFANFVDIRKQVQIQETSAKSKKQVQIQETSANPRNNCRNKKCALLQTHHKLLSDMYSSTRQWTSENLDVPGCWLQSPTTPVRCHI